MCSSGVVKQNKLYFTFVPRQFTSSSSRLVCAWNVTTRASWPDCYNYPARCCQSSLTLGTSTNQENNSSNPSMNLVKKNKKTKNLVKQTNKKQQTKTKNKQTKTKQNKNKNKTKQKTNKNKTNKHVKGCYYVHSVRTV